MVEAQRGQAGDIFIANVMPTITRANTHLTCVMIGERVADWMRASEEN